MQTNFAPDLLEKPDFAASESIIRKCVHCGFCTATCPTYVLLGDELDSPRGRIYLMKEMLENNRPADAETVKHIDRCLSCLACMTTCPSGVYYMHLVDHARRHIAQTYRRPLADRLLRAQLAFMLPYPGRFRAALRAGRLGKMFERFLPARLRTMLDLAPARVPPPSPVDRPQVFAAKGQRVVRVALMSGCAQQVIAPQINEATVRLLTRHGCELVVARGAGCCGALTHHMGQDADGFAKANIDAWIAERDRAGLDAVVINASGCGTTVKDYGFMLRSDPAYAAKAAAISKMTRDITELMTEIGLMPSVIATGQRVAYHSACSLQHGQKVTRQPKALLSQAGFAVVDVPEAHLCCGSAGTYNLLQPEIAMRLRDRKVSNIAKVAPQIIAAGNIGCMTQIASATKTPVVHTAELLDWATGGPKPAAVEALSPAYQRRP
jgi:glycolate oxidase iron-sulfur subunit